MHDNETGAVHRDTVLAVLRWYRVGVSLDPVNPGANLLIFDDVIRSVELDEWVERDEVRALMRIFSRKISIQIHLFYHPEQINIFPDKDCIQ
jgi:hypothetical protein